MKSEFANFIKILELHYTPYVVKGDTLWGEEIIVDMQTGESFALWTKITRENIYPWLGY